MIHLLLLSSRRTVEGSRGRLSGRDANGEESALPDHRGGGAETLWQRGHRGRGQEGKGHDGVHPR